MLKPIVFAWNTGVLGLDLKKKDEEMQLRSSLGDLNGFFWDWTDHDPQTCLPNLKPVSSSNIPRISKSYTPPN